jgi:hypothetical protein
MPEHMARANAARSAIRARVEHVFAHQKNRYPFLFIRGGLKGWREWHKHLLCCRNVVA